MARGAAVRMRARPRKAALSTGKRVHKRGPVTASRVNAGRLMNIGWALTGTGWHRRKK